MLFLFPIFLFACKKEKEEPVDFKFDYAPQRVGHYCVYNVTEINHDLGMADTIRYILKEKIESTFLDAEGRTSLRLERSVMDTSTGSWVISDIWYSTRTTSRYEKVEEDERFIRLAFPVTTEKKWDGNAFNQIGEWEYGYSDVDVARSYNGLNFANTTRVLQRDEFNYVQRHLCYEVFAKNVGLVCKYYKYLDIDGFDSTNVSTGKEMYMNIVSYGVE